MRRENGLEHTAHACGSSLVDVMPLSDGGEREEAANFIIGRRREVAIALDARSALPIGERTNKFKTIGSATAQSNECRNSR